MKRKVWVYVSGPYTLGDPVINVRRALMIAEQLKEFGYIPICPHLFHFWHHIYPHSWEWWLDYDLHLVDGCDCVLRIPGESKGADTEVNHAISYKVPVYFSIDELKNKMPPV